MDLRAYLLLVFGVALALVLCSTPSSDSSVQDYLARAEQWNRALEQQRNSFQAALAEYKRAPSPHTFQAAKKTLWEGGPSSEPADWAPSDPMCRDHARLLVRKKDVLRESMIARFKVVRRDLQNRPSNKARKSVEKSEAELQDYEAGLVQMEARLKARLNP